MSTWAATDLVIHRNHHRLRPSPRASMSVVTSSPSTSTSNPNFSNIFGTALWLYNRRTKINLASHPLLLKLQSCDSPEAIVTALREEIPASSKSQNSDDRLVNWVTPVVNVLYSVSTAPGGDLRLVSLGTSRGKFLL